MSASAETRTYIGLTGTQAFDGYKGLRIDTRYTGLAQDDGTILVAALDAPLGVGVRVSQEE